MPPFNPVETVKAKYFYGYVYDKTLTASQILTDNIKISSDHDFFVTMLNMYASGSVKVLIRDSGTNRMWFNDYIFSANLLGTAQYPNFFPRHRYIPAGSTVFFDLQDQGAAATIQIALIGYQSPAQR